MARSHAGRFSSLNQASFKHADLCWFRLQLQHRRTLHACYITTDTSHRRCRAYHTEGRRVQSFQGGGTGGATASASTSAGSLTRARAQVAQLVSRASSTVARTRGEPQSAPGTGIDRCPRSVFRPWNGGVRLVSLQSRSLRERALNEFRSTFRSTGVAPMAYIAMFIGASIGRAPMGPSNLSIRCPNPSRRGLFRRSALLLRSPSRINADDATVGHRDASRDLMGIEPSP